MCQRVLGNGFVLIVGAFFLNGCDLGWKYLQSPSNLSKEITFVMDNSARFAQNPADPLANVVPGEVRDDLSLLTGCWGTHYVSDFLGIPFLGYDTYSFDPSSGKFRYQVFQTPSVYYEDTADYVVTSQNTIALRNIRRTVEGKVTLIAEGPITVLVTSQGDRLKIAYISMDGNRLDGSTGEPDDLRVPLVFKAFDCP